MDPHFQLPPRPPLQHGAIYHSRSRPSQCLLAGSSSTGNSWKVSCPPLHPAPSAPLKSPLNSVVMQTVSPKRARARCRVRRGWASNAAIMSGGEGGWIIIKASPLPLMRTCLINTRLQGGDGRMNGWRMRGEGALLIHLPAERSVATPQDGSGWWREGTKCEGRWEYCCYLMQYRVMWHLCHILPTWPLNQPKQKIDYFVSGATK